MSETTVNGFEIKHPTEKLSSAEFKGLVEKYGLGGESPAERVARLKSASADTVAVFLTDLNRKLQGSEETLISENQMKVGGESMIPAENRYDLFQGMLDSIRKAPSNVNPSRIGDSLGVGLVMLHPFEDGNGRTSRLMALLYREQYDDPSVCDEAFDYLTQSKEEHKQAGVTTRPVGYVPAGIEDQSNPAAVQEYFDRLFTEDDMVLYQGPAGQAPLHEVV
jgi:Fic/DOC family